MSDLDEELKDMSNEGVEDSESTVESVNSDELLSDAEIERIANMNLDDIIEDATSDSISVEDLFGNSEEKDNAAEKNFTTEQEIEVAQDTETLVTSTADEKQNIEKQPQNDIAASLEHVEENIENESSGKKSKKPKKNQSKKEKKGFFSVVKDIFFESIEEESEENADVSGFDEKKLAEPIPDNPKDENERVLKEMYGDNGEAEGLKEKAAPKKGFFGKFKYRYEQFKKKNEEADQAEQAAEEAEYEEKQRIKEEKKQAAKEKKEQAKQEKAAKTKKEKKPKKEKPKKEKAPKEPPKPGDILRIRPKSMILFVLFIAGVIVLFSILNTGFHYSFALRKANKYLENDNYEKAYQQLAGVDLKDKDEDIYRQISVIMYVQRQYDSYDNYMTLGMKTEALNALIKGIEKYDLYADEAKSLGVGDDVDTIKEQIVSALQNTFKISETEARKLVKLSQEDFTQYYFKIETYGEA